MQTHFRDYMSDMADFPITRIGTPSFVPLLLTNARLASGGLPIEPVLFQSILLCLIAGNKHLILRTVEDDIGLVVKLAVKVGLARTHCCLASLRCYVDK